MRPSRPPSATDADPIDACLSGLRAAVERDVVLAKELRQSWSEFSPGAEPPAGAARGSEEELAARRHLEWFLLEKERSGPEEARIEALIDKSARAAGGSAEEIRKSLSGSRASVFEVKRVEPGRGVWLWDLAGLYECAVLEAEGSRLLEPGDVIAGRLFPTGDSFHRLSRAAAMWRDPRLLAALERDLERARASRPPHLRGSLRLRQSDLESMFRAVEPARPAATDAVADARALLASGGVPKEAIEAFFERLGAEGPRPGARLVGAHDALGDVLEELAFGSGVDLEAARRVLLLAWEQLHAGRADRKPETPQDIAAAVAEFDRKRREGAPLEKVFEDLERDLGLADGAGSEDEDTPAPDFPGVVAAMIDEFLWDEEREHGAETARRFSGLKSLGRFASGLGVFENLSVRELADYACRWLPESRELRDAAATRDLLDALERFCAWAQENHEVRLEEQFGPMLRSLRQSLPRLAEANRRSAGGPVDATDRWFELLAIAPDGSAEVLEEGEKRRVAIDPGIAEHLRPGDVLRGKLQGRGALRLSAGYPSEVRRLELA